MATLSLKYAFIIVLIIRTNWNQGGADNQITIKNKVKNYFTVYKVPNLRLLFILFIIHILILIYY